MVDRIVMFLKILLLLIVLTLLVETPRILRSAKSDPEFLERQEEIKKQEDDRKASLALIRDESKSRYAYSQLFSDREQELYIQIVYCLRSYEETLRQVPFYINDPYKIFDYVVKDYPEYFWVKPNLEIITYKKDDTTTRYDLEFSFTDDADGEKIKAKQKIIDDKVETILRDLDSCTTDYEKAKGVYDYLITHTIYDEKKNDQSMYSVLIEGRGVCSGYAKSFQYLMNRMGVQVALVTGDLREQMGSTIRLGSSPIYVTTGHAWNMVKINDNWYHVDVTTDDTLSSTNSISYEFFLLSYEVIKKTHQIDS
ncbi:MAG: transglutaminase domain-containing protein [Sphaerochaeta sp.]